MSNVIINKSKYYIFDLVAFAGVSKDKLVFFIPGKMLLMSHVKEPKSTYNKQQNLN